MILLTAFKNTSSEKLLSKLKNFDNLNLENHREKSVVQLCDKLNKSSYRLILSFGQRPLIKDKIHFESTARDKGGSEIHTHFDIETSISVCKELGLFAKRSDNAGTSYCNNIYYYGLEYIRTHFLNTKMCFVHIPFEKNISDFYLFTEMIKKYIVKTGEQYGQN